MTNIKKIELNTNTKLENFYVLENEFEISNSPEHFNLKIYKNLNKLNYRLGLYFQLFECFSNDIKNINFYNFTHGGYIILEFLRKIKNNDIVVNIYSNNDDQLFCFNKNIKEYIDNNFLENISGIKINIYKDNNIVNKNFGIWFIDDECYNINNNFMKNKNIVINYNYKFKKYCGKYDIIKNKDYYCYIPKEYVNLFKYYFKYYMIDENEIKFENLIHYTMIIKNAGDILENVLLKNLKNIDQYTILDTGSTDNTVEIIKRVLKDKKGNVYHEPFTNFRESRNHCLDLAYRDNICEYIIMLDDTYIMEGDIRNYLYTINGEQKAESFSIYIKSDDVVISSNRILKNNKRLSYIYRIHEVIQKNLNFLIPYEKFYIDDIKNVYMENRTKNRKDFDLKLLFEDLEEFPNDPRILYYIARTYIGMDNKELAYEYYMKRSFNLDEGFIHERIDAIFEAARLSNFHLNKPWVESKYLYKLAHSLYKKRPDSLYFLGIHYYMNGPDKNYKKAYKYFKKGFEIGFNPLAQYSLKPTLSYHFLPKFLTEICYSEKDFKLGYDSSLFFLQNNKRTDDGYDTVLSFYKIYEKLLLRNNNNVSIMNINNKPLFLLVIDGGFKPWTGSSIEKEGVGGSETWAIETATCLKKLTDYHVILFCNTPNKQVEIYKDVEYRHLEDFFSICMQYDNIEHCFISRFNEYIPTAIHSKVKNIYFIMHDLSPSCNVITIDDKIRKIYCLTNWHKYYFLSIFNNFFNITDVYNYGIDQSKFLLKNDNVKIKNSFIYSSFPNRGLIQILKLWPRIIEKIPDANLHIYCDVYNDWSFTNYPDMMKSIQGLLKNLMEVKEYNINYYGWVDKTTLSEGWKKCEYWLYPCIFMETFCLTALEASISRTLPITNKLAALEDTVGNRGLIIEGDAYKDEWLDKCLEKILFIVDEKNIEYKNKLLNSNYQWGIKLTWENQTKKFLEENKITFYN